MHDAANIPFHLLRPLWLLALIPVAAIFGMLLWRQNPRAQWGGVIAPHLLQHLIVQPGQGRGVSPLYLVTAGLVLGIVALSGPTWRRELPPFVEDKAPLMIVLALSSSMDQADVAPTRLERAKQKIRDLLGARAGARSGLIAYAGTAHLVMPLTDDRSVIEPFLAALATGLMPGDGKNVTAAVSLATQFLAAEPVAGTILVVADDLDEAAIRQAAGRNGVAMLRVVPAQSDGGMGLGSDVVRVSVDGTDIQAIERRVETRFQAAQGDAFGMQWRDEGYWLLFPLALLCLLWFRRGTTVAWVVMLFVAMQALPAKAQEQPFRFADLWLTPDQQGRIAFDRGDYTYGGSTLCRSDVARDRRLPRPRLPDRGTGVPQDRDRGGPLRARQCRGAEPCLGKVDQGVRRGAEDATRPSRGKDQSRDRHRTFRGAGGETPQAGAGRQRATGPEGG